MEIGKNVTYCTEDIISRIARKYQNAVIHNANKVIGLEAELFALRQSKRLHLPPVSAQELLEEKTATWDWRNNTEVELPQVVIDVLLAGGANEMEWQDAINLYQIVGLPSVMNYIYGLPSLRQYFGTSHPNGISNGCKSAYQSQNYGCSGSGIERASDLIFSQCCETFGIDTIAARFFCTLL